MRVLIADDDKSSRDLLRHLLTSNGYETHVTYDGNDAWKAMQEKDAPKLVLLDWMMPGISGDEICRLARKTQPQAPPYIILVTSYPGSAAAVNGLRSGANDYVRKPYNPEELLARVHIGAEMVRLCSELANRIEELEAALAEIKQLRGILPICSYCKRVRDDRDYWQQVDVYLRDHSNAQISHGICPDCFERIVKPEMEQEQEQT
jgi:CheY-like chemotaxis protein